MVVRSFAGTLRLSSYSLIVSVVWAVGFRRVDECGGVRSPAKFANTVIVLKCASMNSISNKHCLLEMEFMRAHFKTITWLMTVFDNHAFVEMLRDFGSCKVSLHLNSHCARNTVRASSRTALPDALQIILWCKDKIWVMRLHFPACRCYR